MPASRDIEAQEMKLAGANPWGMLLGCGVAAAVMLGAAVFMFRDLFTTAFVAVILAVIMVRVFQAAHDAASASAFGDVPLRLAEPLPAIGGRLVARALLPASTTHAGSVFAYLECQSVTYDSEGGRAVKPLWGRKKAYAVKPGPGDLEVQFDLPTDLPPATDDPGAKHLEHHHAYGAWELKLSARLEGVDFVRTYPLPVQPAAPGTLASARPAVKPELLVDFLPRGLLPEAPAAAASAAPVAGDASSARVLVAVNLLPIAGVLWFQWQLYDVVFLYWIETLIVGAFNVLRMAFAGTADGELATRRTDVIAGKIMYIAFFLAHFGGFCLALGASLAEFFPPAPGGGYRLVHALTATLGHLSGLVAVLAIFASHGYSFMHNYIGRGECVGADARLLMTEPYRRIVVTSLFILVGGVAMAKFGEPLVGIMVFVLLKTASDYWHHRSERRRLAPREKTA